MHGELRAVHREEAAVAAAEADTWRRFNALWLDLQVRPYCAENAFSENISKMPGFQYTFDSACRCALLLSCCCMV